MCQIFLKLRENFQFLYKTCKTVGLGSWELWCSHQGSGSLATGPSPIGAQFIWDGKNQHGWVWDNL